MSHPVPDNHPHHRFLVIRTDRLGDVILSTPVLTALKSSFPQAHVAMLVRTYTRTLVEGHPDVDQILVDDPGGEHKGAKGFLRLAKAVRRCHFDTVLVLHPTFRLALLCRMAGIRARTGTAYRAYSFLFNRRLKLHRKKSGLHECDLNLKMAAAVGASLEKVEFKIAIPSSARSSLQTKATAAGLSLKRPYIVIHPGSGGSALDWPVDNFARLARLIVDDLPFDVVITGAAEEKKLINQVAGDNLPGIFRLDGRLELKELAALLQASALMIANSTGPLHLADAVGTKVIGLYCPLQPCRPERWGPYSQLDSILMPPISGCTQCKDNCSYENCMELISVNRVFNAVKERLDLP